MPNPQVTVRVPQNIYDALPTNSEERSTFLLGVITAKLHPPEPKDELAQVKRAATEPRLRRAGDAEAFSSLVALFLIGWI